MVTKNEVFTTFSREESYLALLECLEKYIQVDTYLRKNKYLWRKAIEAEECCRFVHNSLNFCPYTYFV